MGFHKHPNPSLRANRWREGAPLNITEHRNPSLRAHHWPEGAPLNFAKYPNPSLRANHWHWLEGTPFAPRQDELNKKHSNELTKKDQSKRWDKQKPKNKKCSPEKRQGEASTSCPGAMQRQKRVRKGMGSGSDTHTFAYLLKIGASMNGMANQLWRRTRHLREVSRQSRGGFIPIRGHRVLS